MSGLFHAHNKNQKQIKMKAGNNQSGSGVW